MEQLPHKEDIITGFLHLIANSSIFYNIPKVFVASVNSVDVATRTCEVTTVSGGESTIIGGVLLMASVDDGMLLEPTIDSTVLIASMPNADPYILMTSSVSRVYTVVNGTVFEMDGTNIYMETGSSKLNIKDGLIQFNDGSNKGIPKVVPLTDRISRAENKINEFIGKWNAFCASYVPGSPSTTGLPATLGTSTVNQISPITQQSDLEDTKVTH